MRSLVREGKNPPIRKLVLATRKEPIVTASGDLRMQTVTTAVSGRMMRAWSWIQRGLYYHHVGHLLPLDAEVLFWQYTGDENAMRLKKAWPAFIGTGPLAVGGALSYKFSVENADKTISKWAFLLYNRILVFVDTNQHLESGSRMPQSTSVRAMLELGPIWQGD